MVWLYRWPIAVGGGGYFTSSNDFYLPSRAKRKGGGQHPLVSVLLVPTCTKKERKLNLYARSSVLTKVHKISSWASLGFAADHRGFCTLYIEGKMVLLTLMKTYENFISCYDRTPEFLSIFYKDFY
jgi:hypothetical protein